jgi:hypothetical protein
MKKTALIFSAITALAFTTALIAQQAPEKVSGSHLGTWRLVSIKYGNATEFSEYPKVRQRLKMITATHFAWVDYDSQTKKVSSSAGGPYSLREGVYTETLEFVGEGMEPYLGKKQEFSIRIDGDEFFQTGQLSDGLKIEEIWERVK